MGLFDFVGGLAQKVLPAIVGPGAGNLLGSAISGFASLQGGREANQANAMTNAQQLAFNRQEAKAQREWQTNQNALDRSFNINSATKAYTRSKWLANTAHQRQVADLRRAGLNPILSARYGGSATPPVAAPTFKGGSSSAASAGSQQRFSDAVTPAIASATQYRQAAAQVAGLEASADVSRQAAKIGAVDESLRRQQVITEQERSDEVAANADKARSLARLARLQAYTEAQRPQNVVADTDSKRSQIPVNSARALQARAGAALSTAQVRNIAAQLQEYRNLESVDKSDFGKAMAYLKRAQQAGAVSTANELIRGLSGLIPKRLIRKVFIGTDRKVP